MGQGDRQGVIVTGATGTFSPEGVFRAAESLGYRYRDLVFSASPGDSHTPVFEGSFAFEALPSGISLCLSDLRCLYDSEHRGKAERSITLAFAIEGDGPEISFGFGKPVSMSPTHATALTIPETTPIIAQYAAGQRSRALLMRTRPEDIADEAIAEQVAELLCATTVAPMPICRRIAPLIEELVAPSSEGAVGRMLTDGCALALLAHGLLAIDAPPPASAPGLAHRDYVKVLQVRDRMLANPEADFTLPALARDAGMSMTVLKEKFSAVLGQSVFSYLRDVRLQHAKAGLETKGWTVSQAAYFVGYRHHSNFSTAFRRKFGAAPRSFLKR